MTIHKQDARVEAQLHELYTTPEPDPAFTRQLRARIAEQAAQRRSSRLARLWSSVTQAGRFTFGLAGAALLIALVLAGARLLAAPSGAPEPGSGTTPEASKMPTATKTPTAKPPTEYATPRLAPSACAELVTPQPSNAGAYRPSKLLGGGVVRSGDFQINLYLFCDPAFRPESDSTYSELAGLGIYQAYWYSGPDVDEPESKSTVYQDGEAYTQVLPAVALQRGSRMYQKSGIQPDPFAIPDWSARELPMRYLLTVRGAQGKYYGAELTFRLVNTSQGFLVHEIHTAPLEAAELAQVEETSGFQPIYPAVAPESLHPLLGELKALQDRQAARLFSGAGWIHHKVQWNIAGDPYAGVPEPDRPTLLAKDYFTDIWYKVDARGAILGIVHRQTRPDEPSGETILREESYVMPEAGVQDGPAADRPTFDEGMFSSGVEALRRGGAITKQGLDGGVQYTIMTATHETRAVFDPQTGGLREVRYYTLDEDGALSLYSTGTTVTLERTDKVPWEILRLFE